jgi:hypothetical protein
MGTLKTNTVQKANGDPVDLTGQQGIKAWLCVDGSGTLVISDSFNISSVTDAGVGNYDYNFTTDMANADYAVSVDAVDLSNGSQSFSKSARTVSNNRIYSYAGSNSYGDSSAASCSIVGDLA